MILHQNPWQGHDGAPHRNNFDTPPLKGCCIGTWVPICELRENARDDSKCVTE